MRNSPEWRNRLNAHKLDLTQQCPGDRQYYIDGKSDMVHEIVDLALEKFEEPPYMQTFLADNRP